MFIRKKTVDKLIKEHEAKIEQIMADYEAKIAEIVKRYEDEIGLIIEYDKEKRRSDETAYEALVNVLKNKRATKADMTAAMEEAVGYLGENLEG